MARGTTAQSSRTKKKRPVKLATKKKKTTKKTATKRSRPAPKLGLPNELLLKMHNLMVKSRVLEERLIKVYKTGDAYFWIGGPGEEAFGVALGLLAKKGQGPEYDYLHLHYRCTPTLVAMGMPMIASIRLIMNRSTDRCTGGRNFSNPNHYPVFPWISDFSDKNGGWR